LLCFAVVTLWVVHCGARLIWQTHNPGRYD